MNEQEAFVTRLRRRRERNRVPLEEIAQDTRVKLELLQELEQNDLSNWPRGLYARAYIRAYAAAIGLDANDTVDEFCRLFPHGDRRTEPVIRDMAAIVASQTEYRYDYRYATEVDRRRSGEMDMSSKTRTETAMAAVGRAGRAVMSLVGALGSRSPRTASPRS
jgi:cytoskeletal protein RodZ